ncbi:hypothetical protein R3W88_000928 [Solanum pinnatisectum]|uniref:Reverse transcriptase zinc-binding domain-containing protein n=1 Tax=Solanum pinnatisectum TaxID=50273 RepID=A0AAV9MGQ5_9SOLN|nr:hypothetical protein R3W88_000928 [Solanum pinnatisectum]
MLGWEKCKEGLTWIVGNGKRTDFWLDSWIPNTPPLRTLVSGPLPCDELNRLVSSTLKNGV